MRQRYGAPAADTPTSLNSRTTVGLLLCPLPHELQCHTGRRTGFVNFISSAVMNDPALVSSFNKI
jgi:hypothetical protein